ncbi:ATP-dependent RNA helicase [Nematocida homosporus]|uniref:ATP-dependent RNA helicase n=1 Tax=Nematocida homosporus TaxID=1912981 RepID=UPI00221E6AEA|nr:ATP-dependent RNA helicase [Nematocida homosporus]KAI5187273.1 ATP-dependent RNA helicase [Nematocida homosporus]
MTERKEYKSKEILSEDDVILRNDFKDKKEFIDKNQNIDKNTSTDEAEIEEVNLDIESALNQDNQSETNRQMLAGVLVIDEQGGESVLAESFESMGLRDDILKGVYSMGYERPSPIQMTAIVPLVNGRDLRAQAQSGTGKTAAFGIASLQRVDPKLRDIQVIIMETTRELAIQTTGVLKRLAASTDIKIEAVFGGIKLAETVDKINSKPQVLVGTPGRLLHLIEICKLDLVNVKLFVLDEADEMLKKGFLETINLIYNKIRSSKIQVGLFSATWGKTEQDVTKDILNQPVIISLKDEDQTLKGIKQYYIDVGEKRGAAADFSKFEVLCDLYQRSTISQSVIFCNKVERAINIQKNLLEKGFDCELFHSELPQEVRNEVMRRFVEGKCRTLVSSGLLARGVDIQTLSVVINFDVPHEKEIDNYIHRIGRAGRFGRKGTAINLVSAEDREMIKKYEEHYNTTIAPMPMDLAGKLE